MNLYDAMHTSSTRTENGAITHSSTLNANLDLFFRIGASRGRDITDLFYRAYVEDKELATRILLWAGDVRGGAGERDQFKRLVRVLAGDNPVDPQVLFAKVVELTRYDNLFAFVGTPLENLALDFYIQALKSGDKLAAKWCPRIKGAQADIAKLLRNRMGITQKQYRTMLRELSDTVEQKMCAKEFEAIDFEHVPSVAAARYQRAFAKWQPERYAAYRDSLVKGETKINAGAIYPYDCVRSLKNGDPVVASKQWDSLPNYLEGSTERFLPVVDVSGSMGVPVSGSVSAMDIAISLGLYLSERNEGIFKDQFLTFSAEPQMQKVGGTLEQRYHSMSRADWGMSTDLNKTFRVLLEQAVKHSVPQDQMPTKLLIFSDMEFDIATRVSSWRKAEPTNFEAIRDLYSQHGYEVPELVFWNLNSRSNNFPVQKNEQGAALVSGFSPSIMTSLLKGELSPERVMYDTVMKDRYKL